MKKLYILFFCVVSVLFSSCSSHRKIAKKRYDIAPISVNKLLNAVDTSALDFEYLFAKKMDLSLTTMEGEKKNFKATLRMKKGAFMQFSLTAPLGIEVARILITEDSLKFVNYYNKEYLLTDFDFLKENIDSNLSYDFVESIFTNSFFNVNSIDKYSVNYKLSIDSSTYVLSSYHEKKLNRKVKKIYKKRNLDKDYIILNQKTYINPDNFRISKTSIEDMDEGTAVYVEYKNYKHFLSYFFPSDISFILKLADGNVSISIEYQKVEFDVETKANLRIPKKYKMIKYEE